MWVQRNTFDRSYNAHVLLYDDDDAVSRGRGANKPRGFPWNPSGLRFDANLYVETPVSGTTNRYILRAIRAGTANSYFSTAWYAGADFERPCRLRPRPRLRRVQDPASFTGPCRPSVPDGR